MSVMSRKSKEQKINESVDRLVAALDDSGVDKDSTVVLGGSALALAGIRPTHDLDMMVTGEEFENMEATGKTPGGLVVIRKHEAKQHPFLQVYPMANRPLIIPTDITFPYGADFKKDASKDTELTNNLRNFDEVAGYRYLPPEAVAEHKQSMDRMRGKDRRDIRQIGHFLANQRNL